MVNSNNIRAIENLAAEIGENVYMDIAKWHLYLSDAHLAWAVAEQVFPMLVNNTLDESRVIQILENILVPLGEGKQQVPLINMLPTRSQVNLMSILEEYQRKIA